MKRLLLGALTLLMLSISQPSLAQTKGRIQSKKHVQKEVIVYITRTGAKRVL